MVLKSKAAVKSQPPARKEEPEVSTSTKTKRASSKSPARTKSPSRTRSPARTRSPSRKSPSRTKIEVSPPPLQSSTPKVAVPKARSPIRRSPSRKSPTRITKTVTKSAETYFTERVQRPRRTRDDVESDSDTPDGDLHSLSEKPQAAVKGRARRLEVQVEKMRLAGAQTATSTLNLIKRITQNSQTRDVERVVHLKNFDNLAQKMGEFSDEDETLQQARKSVSVERGGEFKPITEFGGTWGALFLTISFPLFMIGILVSCNETQCSFGKVPDVSKYILPSTYLDLSSLLGFVGYAVLVALLTVIPFGGKQVSGLPTKQGKFTYIANGLFTCFVILGIAIGLEFRNIHISEFMVKHLFHLMIASFLFGLVISIYAFVRSFYVSFSSLNAHAIGRSKLYGFFMGREVNPRVFGLLDLKIYVLRLSLIGSLLLDFAYLYKSLSWSSVSFDLNSLSGHFTLFTLTLLHSIYHLDCLVLENVFLTSFEIQYEGCGYISGVGYLLYPFMTVASTKYIVDYNIQLSIWKLLWICLVFTVGYIFYRGSNNQKNAFRRNPYDPALSHLETIPTTKGKKLICSGFWGIVRHPNYLGDILMTFSFLLFTPDVPPALTSLSIIVFLIHRSVRDNVRCKQKYGAAWDRYCNKVKYVLLPKVY